MRYSVSCIFHRKVIPSGDNVAARSLDKEANDRNAARLHVNAQVTFTIAIFEFLYILLYATIIEIISNKISFGSLIQIMGLHFIILPYAFLMNTSHNKWRIVERGWKNILRNMLPDICSRDPNTVEYVMNNENNGKDYQDNGSNLEHKRNVPSTHKSIFVVSNTH